MGRDQAPRAGGPLVRAAGTAAELPFASPAPDTRPADNVDRSDGADGAVAG
jgi:hypothetical protein